MASSIPEGLVTNYGKLGYQLWHRPLKMASLVYEREIGAAETQRNNNLPVFNLRLDENNGIENVAFICSN